MKFILPFFIILMVAGCTTTSQQKQENTINNYKKDDRSVFNNLNTTITDLATQLFKSNVYKKETTNIVLTSFVNLNKLDETTTFGRLISESMFNELHVLQFKVTDYRGQDAINVNEDGEFHMTRDTEKLRDLITGIEFILVGTYVKFENQSLLINARIIDSISGEVISSARSIYKPKDCNIFGICKNIETEKDILDKQQNHLYKTADNYNKYYDDEVTIVPEIKKNQ